MINKYDIIIIGGGASGLMCAATALKRGRSVAIIDHAPKLGQKIIVSGGGRCNFTNRKIGPENYISQNPDFCRSALANFPPENILKILDKYRTPYREEKNGQLFGSSSKIILAALKKEAAGAKIFLNTKVRSVIPEKSGIQCVIKDLDSGLRRNDEGRNSGGIKLICNSLVIATGGLSYKKLGASDFGLKFARENGLNIVATKPGLVPLLADVPALAGVSFKAKVSCRRFSFIDDVLFTHNGLSGPAILQISSYWNPGDAINVQPISSSLPQRYKKYFSSSEWSMVPKNTAGYEKSEVMVGGIDTKELSSKNMEARKIPRVYFIGEILDVTGQLGGYNLHWAFAAGFAAGQSA